MKPSAISLKKIILHEVRRLLREFNYYEKGDRIISGDGEKFIVTHEGPGGGFTAKHIKTGKIRKFTSAENKSVKHADSPQSLPPVTAGSFKMIPKTGDILKNGKRVYDVMYYDDPGYYEVQLPDTDKVGKKPPKSSMFFDSAKETVEWFRKTDSKYDWATAFDRKDDDTPIDYYY